MRAAFAHNRIARWLVAGIGLAALAMAGPRLAGAQGTVQTVVAGIPPVLESPYLGDLAQLIDQGRFSLQVIYISPSRQARSFRVRLTIERDGETVLDLQSDPVDYDPGIHTYRRLDDPPALDFGISYTELSNLLDDASEATGLLPEGAYTLTAEAMPEDEDLLLPSIPGMATFDVRYAEPPLLLWPADQTVLTSPYPVFSWAPIVGTPVGSLFEYELLLVEVLPGQAPYQALESNREHARIPLLGQTAFAYTAEQLPLQKDRTYVWHVRARDAAGLLPVLASGETEYHTFTVGTDGPGGMIASWSYPINNPFLVYAFPDPQALDPDQAEFYLDGVLPVDLNGMPAEAIFDRVTIDGQTQAILDGQVILETPLTLEIALHPLTDAFAGHAFVPIQATTSREEGLWLTWNGPVRIDRDGLHPTGTHPARIAYTGIEGDTWSATYSPDFSLSVAPFGITRGRIDFVAGGIAGAYADAAGFHVIDRSDPLLAQIPDRLVVETDRLAYIPLKRNGVPLVAMEPQAGGRLALSSLPGTRLELVVPAFQGTAFGEAPRLDAVLDAVTVASGSGTFAGGTITATMPAADSLFTLDAVGAPLVPTNVTIGVSGDEPRMAVEGRLTLLGRPVRHSRPISVTVDRHGRLTGRLGEEPVAGLVPVDERGMAVLSVDRVEGAIDVPLLGGGTPVVALNVDGEFRMMWADTVVARAAVGLAHGTGGEVALTRFASLAGERSIQVDAYTLRVDAMDALRLGGRGGQTPQFAATLRSALMFAVGADTLRIPLHGVELSDAGLYVPEQDIHGATPGFSGEPLSAGPFDLTLLAVRIPATSIEHAGFLDVRLDFEARPARDPFAGAIARAPLTVQDAHLRDGFIDGPILPYPFAETPVVFPLQDAIRFEASEAAGRLFGESGKQGFEFDLAGRLTHRSLIPSTAGCPSVPARVRLSSHTGISGGSEPFAPCGVVPAGPLTLAFDSARVQVTTEQGVLMTGIEGNVARVYEPLSGRSAPARGMLHIDLQSHRVVDGSVDLDAFEWAYPTSSPLFAVAVEGARIDPRGVTFLADSSLAARRLSDDAPLRFVFSESFVMGFDPSQGNVGHAEFHDVDDVLASFDAGGFAITQALAPDDLPDRVALPGLSAYLSLRSTDGTPTVSLVRSERGRILLRAGEQTRLHATRPIRFSAPVSGEVEVNAAFEVIGGTLVASADSGATFETTFAPLRVEAYRAAFDEAARQFSAIAEVAIALPQALAPDSAAVLRASIPLHGSGGESVVASTGRSWYDDRLRLVADRVGVRSDGDEAVLQVYGTVSSLLFEPDSTAHPGLRFAASFRARGDAWDLSLDTSSLGDRSFAVGYGTFALDPMLTNRLQANPLPVLSLAGTVSFPGLFSAGDGIGLAVEIGPAGVYLDRPSTAPEAPEMFAGLLRLEVSRLEWSYDESRRTLVATLDGAFRSPLFASATIGRVPVREAAFGLDGRWALDASTVPPAGDSIPVYPLLPAGQTVEIIPGTFHLDTLAIVPSAAGWQLDLKGAIQLPDPSERAATLRPEAPGSVAPLGRRPPSAVSPSASALFPTGRVAFHVGTDGSFAGQEVTFDGLTLPEAPKAAFQVAFGDAGVYQYEAAALVFDPWEPADARLLASARLFLRPGDAKESEDSTGLGPTDIARWPSIAFGSASDPTRQPGLVVGAGAPIRYLTAFRPGSGASFDVGDGLFTVRVDVVSLPDPGTPAVALHGRARLDIPGVEGAFDWLGLTIGPEGWRHAGRPAGAATLHLPGGLAVQSRCVEVERRSDFASVAMDGSRLVVGPDGAVDRGPEESVPVRALVRLGATCPDGLRVALADGTFAGRADALLAYRSLDGTAGLTLRGVEMPLLPEARLIADLALGEVDGAPALTIAGATRLQGVTLSTDGHLRLRQGRPSLALRFAPTDRALDWLPGLATIRPTGGGFYYRPGPADLDPLAVLLDERHSTRFKANGLAAAAPFALYLPADITLAPADPSRALDGAGLLTVAGSSTYLDFEGALFDRRGTHDATLSLALIGAPGAYALEGTGTLAFRDTSLLVGNAEADVSVAAGSGWSIAGRGRFVAGDTLALSGRYQAGPEGILFELTGRPAAGRFLVPHTGSFSLWLDPRRSVADGFWTVESDLALIPGVQFGRTRLIGTVLDDGGDRLLYGAANLYVDVPFVYSGPLDPWLAAQGGGLYAGDARNVTFRRMVSEARQHSAAVPTLAAATARQLAEAARTLAAASTDRYERSLPGLFGQPDAAVRAFGEQLAGSEATGDDLPEGLAQVAEDLYTDADRPDRGLAEGAWQALASAVQTARKSADADIFSLENLSPRSILWLTDQVELPIELRTSPIRDTTWPDETEGGRAGFAVDTSLVRRQRDFLHRFKTNNEVLDASFLRAIGNLELNLVNAKIARSPEAPADVARATAALAGVQAEEVSADWALRAWAIEKREALLGQERAIERSLEEQLGAVVDAPETLRRMVDERLDRIKRVAAGTGWLPAELQDEPALRTRLAGADGEGLRSLFRSSGKWLWYDAPAAALAALADTLAVAGGERAAYYAARNDSVSAAYARYTASLDPFYDVQTAMTTTLFGMAEEYKNWRASIRGLDPEAVNMAFQFVPYRGNYRVLAEDLVPPRIDALKIGIEPSTFSTASRISWEVDHPVEVADVSVAVVADSDTTARFASVAAMGVLDHTAYKRDAADRTQAYRVMVRARGAGGLTTSRTGRFEVTVDPGAQMARGRPDSLLVPLDVTAPPAPALSALAYSAYFSEESNTLSFAIGSLADDESGIASLSYRLIDERTNEALQDWTEVTVGASAFGGRRIETGLPTQERDLTVRVEVRAVNGAGLLSESQASLSIAVDDTPPMATLAALTYTNVLHPDHPNSLGVTFDPLRDPESGIARVEYVFVEGPEANLAEATWIPILEEQPPARELGEHTVVLAMADRFVRDQATTLNAVFRVTNGAGQQVIVRRAIQIPSRDITAPSEPQIALRQSGQYESDSMHQLHVLISEARDVESGIERIRFRVLDGSNGQPVYDWDDFVEFDRGDPAFYPAPIERALVLPAFEGGRPLIVEAFARNRAGADSRTSVAFFPLESDESLPPAPEVELDVRSDEVIVNVGPATDPESGIADAAYRLFDSATRTAVADWQPLDGDRSGRRFAGATIAFPSSVLATSATTELHVRFTNGEGLSSTTSRSVGAEAVRLPLATPEAALYVSQREGEKVFLVLRPIDPPFAVPTTVRYRLRDADNPARPLTPWRDIAVGQGERFAGQAVALTWPDSLAPATVVADVVTVGRDATSVPRHAALSLPRGDTPRRRPPAPPPIDALFVVSPETPGAGRLDIDIGESYDERSELTALRYRVLLEEVQGRASTWPSDSTWTAVEISPGAYFPGTRVIVPFADLALPASARVEVRIETADEREAMAEITVSMERTVDSTPPEMPPLHVALAEQTPARIRIVAGTSSDPESDVSEMAYRIVDAERPEAVLVDWTPMTDVRPGRSFVPDVAEAMLAETTGSRSLRVLVRSVNGAGLVACAEAPLTLVDDRTPPQVVGAALAIEPVAADAAPQLRIVPGLVFDEQSDIDRIAYRLDLVGDSSVTIQEWTEWAVPDMPRVRPAEVRLPFPSEAGEAPIRLTLRATNAVGLEVTESVQAAREADTTTPQLPRVEATFVDEGQGAEGYLLVQPGAFRDPESSIDALEYRVVDARTDSIVYRDWVSLPAVPAVRISTSPFSISRTEFPFAGTRDVAVEIRARNGAGLVGTSEVVVAIPGDTSPPELPAVQVVHHNAYATLEPNSLEIRIGPTEDPQSGLVALAYRMRLPGTESSGAWTEVQTIPGAGFPGGIVLVDLPLLTQDTRAEVDVRVVNGAGLVTTATTVVDVAIVRDETPPVLAIALHYFSDEVALVLDALSDEESRIHRVEYRFLDNVDQSVLADWRPVFEIALPQTRFERQLYLVDKPEIRSGRTLKVEVRTTNGAGLQTIVSKTLLFRTPGIGE
jgi:hypothetical protein